MKATKSLDCVEMKDQIQARLLQEMEHMTDPEQRAYIRRRLDASDSPVGRLWRTLIARQARQRQPHRPPSNVRDSMVS
jgi:hypothetical protein